MRTSRLTSLLVTALLGVVAGWGALAPAAEAASGRCTPGTGVTVVVDFGPLGSGTEIGCDPKGAGDPASKVTPNAGFPITYASGQPFVCRIKGLPDASQEPCNRTPPGNAYWGLFWSDGTSTKWTYATSGAAGLEVPEGGSIGWRFQDGGDRENPGAAPTQKPKATPTPTPTPSPSPTKQPTQQPTQPPATATPSATPSASQTPSAGSAKAGASKAGASKAAAAKADRAERREAKQRQREDDAALASSDDEDGEDGEYVVADETATAGEPVSVEGGSSLPLTLAAGGIVVALGAAALVIARRRRI